jgi:DNA (cytosine-5)-methyltransferase 1
MLRLAKGAALDVILSSLEQLGYSWAYRVIDSRAFGLPQRRERVFFVACPSGDGDPRDVLLSASVSEPERQVDSQSVACGFYWTEGTRGLGWAVDAVPTLKGGSTVGIPSPPAIVLRDGRIVKPSIRDAERMQGFPADWTMPAEKVGRSGFRWKLVGNAVTVDVAQWIGEQLRRPGTYEPVGETSLDGGTAWPQAAYNVGEGRVAVRVSKWPVALPAEHLEDFLEHSKLQPLSRKATAGFLSRFEASSLSRPVGFLHALRSHLRTVDVDIQVSAGRDADSCD